MTQPWKAPASRSRAEIQLAYGIGAAFLGRLDRRKEGCNEQPYYRAQDEVAAPRVANAHKRLGRRPGAEPSEPARCCIKEKLFLRDVSCH